MNNSMKKLIMFDFDGTICDTLDLFHCSFTAGCHEVGIAKYDSLECFLGLFDNNLYESLAQDGIDESTIQKVQILLSKELCGKLTNCSIFDGLTEVLSKLKQDGSLLFIITSSISSIVEEYLASKGLDMFSDVLGADSGTSKIDKIVRIVKENPEYTPYYVGDTVGDMLEGNKAGCITIGVAWGWHGADKLGNTDADIVSHEPWDLYDDISRICR